LSDTSYPRHPPRSEEKQPAAIGPIASVERANALFGLISALACTHAQPVLGLEKTHSGARVHCASGVAGALGVHPSACGERPAPPLDVVYRVLNRDRAETTAQSRNHQTENDPLRLPCEPQHRPLGQART